MAKQPAPKLQLGDAIDLENTGAVAENTRAIQENTRVIQSVAKAQGVTTGPGTTPAAGSDGPVGQLLDAIRRLVQLGDRQLIAQQQAAAQARPAGGLGNLGAVAANGYPSPTIGRPATPVGSPAVTTALAPPRWATQPLKLGRGELLPPTRALPPAPPPPAGALARVRDPAPLVPLRPAELARGGPPPERIDPFQGGYNRPIPVYVVGPRPLPVSGGGGAGEGGKGKTPTEKALNEFAASQKRLFERAGILSNLGLHGMAGSMARVGGFAEGLHGMGFSGAGALVSRGAAPIAAAMEIGKHGLAATKTVAGIANDELLTQGQRERALFKGLVPGGESALDWYDTVSGRKRAMQRQEEEHGRMGIRTQRDIEFGRTGLALSAEQAGYSSRATALAGAHAVTMPYIERTTLAGERAHELQAMLMPARERMMRADVAAKEATLKKGEALGRLGQVHGTGTDLEIQLRHLEARRDGLDKARLAAIPNRPGVSIGNAARAQAGLWMSSIGGVAGTLGFKDTQRRINRTATETVIGGGLGPEGPERQKILDEIEQTRRRIEENERRKGGAAREVFETEKEEAQAKAEQRKARAQYTRTQAEYDEKRSQHAAGTATRLAGMGLGERMKGRQMYLMAKQNPALLAMSPELAAGASAYAPELTRKMLEQQGQGTEDFEFLRQEGEINLEKGETIEGVRKKATEGKNKAAEEDLAAEKDASSEIVEKFKKNYQALLDSILAAYEQMNETFNNKLLQARNAAS